MRLLRRSLPLVAAIILCGLATFLVLLAVDARAWQRSLGANDIRFQVSPSYKPLWRSPAILPGDPARAILGLGDALALRDMLQSFWLNEVGVAQSQGNDFLVARIATQTELEALASDARTAAEQSSAANLLGVMTVWTAATDNAALLQIIYRSAFYFRLAVVQDPANWAAKVNLELALRLGRSGTSQFKVGRWRRLGLGRPPGSGAAGGGF